MTTLSKWEYNAGAKARKNPMFTINTFAAEVSGTYQHVMLHSGYKSTKKSYF